MKTFFKNRFVILALAAALGAGLWAVKVGRLHGPQLSKINAAKALYHCPMHPFYTSDKPGKCPICHMDLVLTEEEPANDAAQGAAAPREFTLEQVLKMKPGELCMLHKCKMGNCLMVMTEEFARLGKCPHCGEDLGIVIKDLLPQDHGPVKLGLEKRQMIGVTTETVEKRSIHKTIRAAASVAHDAELYQAQAEFIEALQALQKAREGGLEETIHQSEALADAARVRLRHLGLSEDLVAEVSRQKEPDHGLLYAHAGSPVWLYASVYDYEISDVKPGQEMTAETPSYPGKIFKGVVKSVDPMVDMKTRTTRVRARFENPEALLRPDMFINASIEVDVGSVLAIPRSAVLETGTRRIVFVEKEPGFFEPREAVLGPVAGDFYPVQSGVLEGEKVVTSGNFLIDSESRLKAALQGSSQKGAHVHGV